MMSLYIYFLKISNIKMITIVNLYDHFFIISPSYLIFIIVIILENFTFFLLLLSFSVNAC